MNLYDLQIRRGKHLEDSNKGTNKKLSIKVLKLGVGDRKETRQQAVKSQTRKHVHGLHNCDPYIKIIQQKNLMRPT